MAKRFTDTEKFTDSWYRRLSTPNKLLWDWILCNCDHAGIISIDLEFAEMVLGEKFEDDVLQNHFKERLVSINNGKHFIPKFIKFQYGKLNSDSRVHKSVISRLNENGIDIQSLAFKIDTLSIPYEYPIDSPKDKDKNKDKDKAKDSYSYSSNQAGALKVTPDLLIDLWNQNMGKDFGFAKGGLGCGKHLDNFFDAVKFLSTAESWLELFEKCKQSAFLRGESDKGWKVSLTWLVNYDNALRVLSDEFDDQIAIKNLFAGLKSGEIA
jgi:hypothetical protein